MFCRFINCLKNQLIIGFIILTAGLCELSANSEGSTQVITCVHNQVEERKQISIEYLNSKSKACRTIYYSNENQGKQIAWAQKNPTLCSDVADKLASRLGSLGWNCSADTLGKPPLKTHTKTRKKMPRSAGYVDDKMLLKGILK